VQRSLKAHLLLIFCTFLWGAAFVVVKDALGDATPLRFNAMRIGSAALCLLVVLNRRLWPMRLRTFAVGCFVGLWMYLGFELQTAGLALTTPSKSAFLTGLSVILTPLMLALFWRRRIRLWTAFGAAAALGGLYLLTMPGGASFELSRGDLLTIGNAVAWTFQIIFLSRATQRHPFEQIVAVEMLSAGLLMALTAPLLEPQGYLHWTPRMGWAMAAMVLLPTVFAMMVQGWAQKFTPPTHAALIYALEPVFTAIVSYLWLGERLGWRGGMGAALILGGVVLSEVLGATTNEAEVAEEAG